MLWVWCRPAATALIQPLAWELSYATGAALKKKRKEKEKNNKDKLKKKKEALKLQTQTSGKRTVEIHSQMSENFPAIASVFNKSMQFDSPSLI